MVRIAAFVLLGALAGVVVTAWWQRAPAPLPARAVDTDAGLGARLDALESTLTAERERRFELEDQVAALADRLAALPGPTLEDASARGPVRAAETPDVVAVDGPPPGARGAWFRGPPSGEDLLERFVAEGFSVDRAQWLLQRTEELRMQALQTQYDIARATGSGGQMSVMPLTPGSDVLRTELGDADYERYLRALGRPTSVSVDDVLARSPAEQAGFKPGDEIVAFDGTRVFEMLELNRLTLEGEPGQTVVVEVMREGQRVQLYIPRGPMGIMGGPGSRRAR